MSGLRLGKHASRPQQPQSLASSSKRSRSIIEISDDESAYGQRPGKSRSQPGPSGTPHPSGLRDEAMVITDDESESDSDSSIDLPIIVARNNRNGTPAKRMKLQHETQTVTFANLNFKGRPFEPTPAPESWVNKKIDGPKIVFDPGPKPYCIDPTFSIRMFCGQGFEEFNVALGTIDGHDEICAVWDVKSSPGYQDLQPLRQQSKYTQAQDQCLAHALGIYPDIDHEFVRQQFDQAAKQAPHLAPEDLPIDIIVSAIADFDGKHPRKAKEIAKKKQPEPA
jgi:hypothetical protein